MKIWHLKCSRRGSGKNAKRMRKGALVLLERIKGKATDERKGKGRQNVHKNPVTGAGDTKEKHESMLTPQVRQEAEVTDFINFVDHNPQPPGCGKDSTNYRATKKIQNYVSIYRQEARHILLSAYL